MKKLIATALLFSVAVTSCSDKKKQTPFLLYRNPM
jgi:hypothetical protein